ncbi:MAG: hypothetical protein FWC51_04455 [Proteobacteria bacterium]|nr:hypothetical protein [Pseudomonadota bacterium]
MFDSSLIVQSAMSSFNNAALSAPDFFWNAVLAIPIFVVAWIFGRPIADKILPDVRARRYYVSFLAIASIFVWILAHQSFMALREDFSWVGILVAVVACGASAFISRRYYATGWRFTDYLNINNKWRNRIDYAVPAAIVVIAGFCGEWSWTGFALGAGAVAIGWASGYFLNKLNRPEFSATTVSAFLMGIVSYGLIMQPEFFRFGMMGNLTAIHLAFVAAIGGTLAAYMALHFVRPRGKFGNMFYKNGQIFLWLVIILLFAMMIITESALMFIAIAVASAASAYLYVRHTPDKDSDRLRTLANDFWIVSLGLFGILTMMPALTAAAVVLWRVEKQVRGKR